MAGLAVDFDAMQGGNPHNQFYSDYALWVY